DNEEFGELHEVVGSEKLWELYITKLVDDLEKLPGNIVGHFYAPTTFGRWPLNKKLEEHEDRMLDVAHRRGMAVEVNTRFLYRDYPEDRKKKYLEANARLVRKAKARGVGIAVGSDAHSPKDQGNAFGLILKLLDEARVNEVVFPVAGRLARVALRATREHLEAQAQALRQPSAPGSSITGYSRAELGLPEAAELPSSRRSARTRDAGPKKRVGDSARAVKRPAVSTPPSASTSRRSPDSSSSANKAKIARLVKPAALPKQKKTGKKAISKPAAGTARKSSPTVRPAKKAARKSVSRKPAAAKTTARKSAARKSPVRKSSSRASGTKKVAAKKPASRKGPKPKRLAGYAKKSVKKKKTSAKRR
ncbi:MAG TPA: hypothetical protein VIX60_03535, partial [Candidatus Cybelea sp.]